MSNNSDSDVPDLEEDYAFNALLHSFPSPPGQQSILTPRPGPNWFTANLPQNPSFQARRVADYTDDFGVRVVKTEYFGADGTLFHKQTDYHVGQDDHTTLFRSVSGTPGYLIHDKHADGFVLTRARWEQANGDSVTVEQWIQQNGQAKKRMLVVWDPKELDEDDINTARFLRKDRARRHEARRRQRGRT